MAEVAPTPPISAIKPNLEAKALVPVAPVKTIKEATGKPKFFGEDVKTGELVEVELLDENDPRANPKAPEKTKKPQRESPPHRSETKKPPEPELEAPPQKKPQETRARRVIRRHEPITKRSARTVLTELAAKTSAPPQETSLPPPEPKPESTPSENQPKSPEPSPIPPQPEAPQPAPAEPESTQTVPSPQPEAAKDTTLEQRTEIDAMLKEAAQLLFDIKDARVVLTALGRQAADTPLGREFADQVLAMVQNIDTKSLSADKQQAFDALKQKMLGVRPLPQPETKLQDTELHKFLKTQPANEHTAVLIQALEQGATIPNVVNYVMKHPEFQTVASSLRKELFGNKPIPQTPEMLLEAAGIEKTDANVEILKQMLNPVDPKDKLTIKKLGTYLLIILMVTMLSSQILTPMMAEAEGQPSGR